MRAYQFARAETVHELTAETFGGADFSTHPTKVALSRSPDMKNMQAGERHFLVKRTGYKRVCTPGAAVYGLFALPGDTGEALCHSGDTLYLLGRDGALTALVQGAATRPSAAFHMGGKLYLLDGAVYRVIAKNAAGAWQARAVSEIAFVPTTTIAAPPGGGGTPFEAVNLLSARRINTFVGDGAATQFTLDARDIDDAPVTATVDGAAMTVTAIDRAAGVVTLAAAPKSGAGLANVTITFSKTVPGYAEKIGKCRIAGLYGGKNDTRVFLSGNPDEPATDWQSGLYDPTYFPDTGFTKIGTDASPIMGYVKQFESQLVIKAGGTQEASQYLRGFLMAEDGTALYPLKQGAQGVGAVSARCFGSLGDVPLFLSRDGVMGVYGTAVAEQRLLRGLSRAVDARLTREDGLENACGISFEDKYYLAVNGRCYVADGRIFGEDGAPAWYYWDNLPATCFAVLAQALYFGTADGRVLRLCRADEKDAYYDDEAAIDAYWCTPELALGAWSRYKNVRAFYPLLMSYARSGARVEYLADGNAETVMTGNLDLFAWDALDFGRFSFRCIPGASPFYVRKKLRRVSTVQLRVGNDRPGEPFGLLALVLRYTQGQTVK